MGLEPKYFPYVVGLLSIGYGLGNGQTFLAIDPSLQFSQSQGRIKCSQQELLCIGETHQANWRAILFGLARLNYIAKIIPHWGE